MDVKGIRVRTVLLAVTLLSMLWGYRLLLTDHAPVVFRSVEEDLSYGWFVPLFSLYILWRERAAIRASLGAPSAWGILLALPFLFLGFIGARGAQIRFEIVGFIGTLLALAWSFFGVRTLKQVAFAALFLLFCLPLHSFLDIVTIHLRLFAVSCAYGLLDAFGIEVVRQGTMILSPTGAFAVDVASPCSGLRSLFAMMALTAGYAYFTQPTWTKRAVLFALSVPIAIFGNIVRIFSIVVVASVASPDFATGFYHDYSGYVVFLVAIALMVAAGEALGRLGRGTGERGTCGRGTLAASIPPESRPSIAIPILSALLVLAVMLWQGQTLSPVLAEAPAVSFSDIPGMTSEDIPASEAELKTLPADTRIVKRLYRAKNGLICLVTAVTGGASKSSIHRPELCLPSQGFQMSDPRTRVFAGTDWHLVTLTSRDAAPMSFAYTFYNQAGCRTCSHVGRIMRDVWDRSVLGRIDRWVMVTVQCSTADERCLGDFLSRVGVVK